RRLRRERKRALSGFYDLGIAKAFDTTATLNPILTTVANQFMRDPSGFVGIKLLPPFASAIQSGKYYLFTAAELAQVPNLAARAPGSAYPRLKQSLSNDSFACEDYGIEGPVADEDRKKYSTYFDADLSTTRRLVDTIRVNHEQRVYNLVTTGGTPSAAVAVPWNDATSNPKGDVDAAREGVRQNIGLLPNLLIITQPMLNALSIHPKILDVFKYTTPGVLTEDRLAAYFQIQEVAIAKNVIATNNEGQAFVPADIWGNNAVVAHVNDAQDLLVPNFGRTFYWTAFTSTVDINTGGTGPAMTAGGGGPDLMQVFSYRDETVKSDIHRTEHYVGEKLTAVNAGYVLQNPLR
ncbi:MAG TPA: hypothetical protein VFB72_00910, partial [Verrucomicrobiae bacterium]|nr:hypothetical protein [Verrucomicrobiae bacterium]